MNSSSGVSSYASNLSLRHHNSLLRQDMQSVGRELSSGERSLRDVARSSEERAIQKIDESLSLLTRYQQATTRASIRLDAVQLGLDSIRSTASHVTLGVLSAISANDSNSINIQSAQATSALESVVSTLNKSVSGESLFSGAALGSSAISSSNDIILDVETIINSAPDAATAIANVDAYFFTPTGGFDTGIYTGSTTNSGDLQISETSSVSFDIRADNSSIKETIRNLSIIAAVSNGSFSTQPADRALLLDNATATGLNTEKDLISIQERIGNREEVVNIQGARNKAEELAYAKTRSEIASADLYETASKLEQLQIQLESMYHVTSKLSELSLLNFVR